jgi:hypothetical protein
LSGSNKSTHLNKPPMKLSRRPLFLEKLYRRLVSAAVTTMKSDFDCVLQARCPMTTMRPATTHERTKRCTTDASGNETATKQQAGCISVSPWRKKEGEKRKEKGKWSQSSSSKWSHSSWYKRSSSFSCISTSRPVRWHPREGGSIDVEHARHAK